MNPVTPERIERFMHGQAAAWNAHDKAGLLALYREVAAEHLSIEYVGREQVYDIEVEGTHNFIGNGIFAHNTSSADLERRVNEDPFVGEKVVTEETVATEEPLPVVEETPVADGESSSAE